MISLLFTRVVLKFMLMLFLTLGYFFTGNRARAAIIIDCNKVNAASGDTITFANWLTRHFFYPYFYFNFNGRTPNFETFNVATNNIAYRDWFDKIHTFNGNSNFARPCGILSFAQIALPISI